MKKAKIDPALALEEHQEGYCPLDLYSGDDMRIGRAIEALWRAWELSEGAANNLRFFYEGVRVEPTDVSARKVPSLALASPLLASTSTPWSPISTPSSQASHLFHHPPTLRPPHRFLPPPRRIPSHSSSRSSFPSSSHRLSSPRSLDYKLRSTVWTSKASPLSSTCV